MTHPDNPRNWPEDYNHENGEYFNDCATCKEQFVGHKRRPLCKVCANKRTIIVGNGGAGLTDAIIHRLAETDIELRIAEREIKETIEDYPLPLLIAPSLTEAYLTNPIKFDIVPKSSNNRKNARKPTQKHSKSKNRTARKGRKLNRK